ncbi:MAG: DUF5684 domain-containing protein [Actinomycetia bacterium]|nr:DUF5684 domain-containing protein [Actinomycetes bacterium]
MDYGYGSTLSSPAFGSLLAGIYIAFLVFYLFLIVIVIAEQVLIYVSYWVMFRKAGRKSWPAVVPILNSLMLLDIAGKPWWYIFFLPFTFLNLLVYIDLARAFGKSVGWAFGLSLVPIVFFPILALSKDITYTRPADFPPAWLEV